LAEEQSQLDMLQKAMSEILSLAEGTESPPAQVLIYVPTPNEATYRVQFRGHADYEGGYITA
jgi:hypothetical protein